MKKNIYLFLLILFCSCPVWAQNVEVVQDEVRQTTYQNKSYLVIKSLTLKPPVGGGSFSVSAATNGSFYIKIADAAKNPSNVPPSMDQNFTRIESINVGGITSQDQIASLDVVQKSVGYKYVDGLGRPLLDVSVKGSPLQGDVIQPYAYDNLGRTVNEYLPYTGSTTNGAFRSDALSKQSSFYGPLDSKPYTLNSFDNSPFNQVMKAYGAGSAWHPGSGGNDKSVQTIIKSNVVDEIKKWNYDGTALPSTVSLTANTLTISQITDEQGLIFKTYKDFKGQTVLERKGDGTTWFDTYYVYDPIGNLGYVFPPAASNKLSEYISASAIDKQVFLDRWCFQYKYDLYQRLTDKKIPGADWIYMIYDPWDRVVFTQDGNLRLSGKWLFNKYDELNRLIIKGTIAGARSNLTTSANGATIRFEGRANNSTGYTNNSLPSAALSDMISLLYYDDYLFKSYSNWGNQGKSYSFVNESGFPQASDVSSVVVGQATGSKVRVLDTGTETWLNSVIYYDNKYRVLQTVGDNYLNGQDRVTNSIDFTGKILKSKQVHSGTGNVSILNEFAYDHAGRVKQTYQTIDGGTRTLLQDNQYNELGQLIEKNIHSTDNGVSFLQSVDYRYNIRGWLSSINNSSLSNDGSLNNDSNDLFGMEMKFNQGSTIAGTAINALHNGNISSIQWSSNNLRDTPSKSTYGYKYDVLNRLTNAIYANSDKGSTWDNGFNESMTYDKNGNIKTLSRNSMMGGETAFLKTIDLLDYKYGTNSPDFDNKGNQLTYIDDASSYSDPTQNNPDFGFAENTKQVNMGSSNEYSFDNSGNLTIDYNKGITGSTGISYNILNMPKVIPLQGGGTITYTYDALGNKLRKVAQLGSASVQTDYAGDIHYQDGQIAFILNGNGRALKNGSSYSYEYFHKDHLGNTRVVYGYQKETKDYRATLEPERNSRENLDFKNISGTAGANRTPKNSETPAPFKSAALNGSVGPAKMLTVGNGDNVTMEAYAYYNQAVSGSTATGAAIATAVINAFTIGVGEGAYSAMNNNVPGAVGSFGASPGAPKAFIFYYLFSPDFTSWSQFGYAPVTIASASGFSKISLNVPITLPNGISQANMYIYVANQTTGTTVYFDDLGIVHEKNNNALQVVQTNDYYPFGLSIAPLAYQKQLTNLSVSKNKYKFQEQERQEELSLGWDQFKYRMYDPAVGRFGAVDPLSEKYLYNSPYAFSENRVTDGVDLEGTEWKKTGTAFDVLTGMERDNFSVSFKVVNNTTSYTNEQLMHVLNSTKPVIENVFSNPVKNDGTQMFDFSSQFNGSLMPPRVSLSYEMVDKKSITDNDFVMVMSDNIIDINGEIVEGFYGFNGYTKYVQMLDANKVILNMSSFRNYLGGFDFGAFSQVLSHEIGHTAGLNHYERYLKDLGLVTNSFMPAYPGLFNSPLQMTPFNAMFSGTLMNTYSELLKLQQSYNTYFTYDQMITVYNNYNSYYNGK